jgi:hypothetical protein
MENQGMNICATRRDFLHVGFAGGIGLTLAEFFRMKEARADIEKHESQEGTAKGVIFIYLPGGAPHQETFDPKPFAPVEYRGPMGSIATSVDGIVLNECLAQTAKVAEKIALCRSMTHGEAAHAEQFAAIRLRSQHAHRICGDRLPELVVRAVQPGKRSG